MTKKQLFIALYFPYAHYVESKTGLASTITLTQAALESGWGEKAIGNNFFGIKAKKDTPLAQKQLFVTREVLKKNTTRFPEILSISKRADGMFEYRVRDWFRKYATPAESFADYANLFQRLSRYHVAWQNRANPDVFFAEIHKAGYATAPNYTKVLQDWHKEVVELVEEFEKQFLPI
jgi:flagellum-specific peptidoglycan hydrolase FlgJ